MSTLLSKNNGKTEMTIAVKEVDHGEVSVPVINLSDEDDQVEEEMNGKAEESNDEENRELEERLKELEDTDEWLKDGLPWFPDIANYPLPLEEDTATSYSTEMDTDEDSEEEEEDDPTSAVAWLKDYSKNKRTRRGGFYGTRNLG